MMKALASCLAIAVLACSSPSLAQDQAPDPLFAQSSNLAITLDAPLDTLFRNRQADDPVTGTVIDDQGNRLPVRVALRGITRRSADVCAFPPLSIRFEAPPPATSVFAGQRKLKLVTHCRTDAGSDRAVLLEYAAYRLFNVVTPKSFLARLATITYRSPGGATVATRPAFFIEDIKDVARRNGLAEAKGGTRVPLATLSPDDSATYGLFQHMIANHDWSMRAGPQGEDCCHNAKLLGEIAPGRAIPTPYDFDFSGFVDAPYASPPDQLNLASVRERKYRGYCAHNQAVMAAAKLFRDKQSAILAELDAIPGLDPASSARAKDFLRPFFAEIATDASVQANILPRCVG